MEGGRICGIGVHVGIGKPVAGFLDERHIAISCLRCAYIHGPALLTEIAKAAQRFTF
jgi:hypothetical protein